MRLCVDRHTTCRQYPHPYARRNCSFILGTRCVAGEKRAFNEIAYLPLMLSLGVAHTGKLRPPCVAQFATADVRLNVRQAEHQTRQRGTRSAIAGSQQACEILGARRIGAFFGLGSFLYNAALSFV